MLSRARLAHRTRLLLLVAVASVGGCYPIYKTLQPSVDLTVRDAQARPVAGARVTLITNFNPSGRDSASETVRTDSLGMVRFPRRAEWQMETLMIHGAKLYYWNWCVQMPGFATIDTRRSSRPKFTRRMSLTLQPGESVPCLPSR